MMNTDLLITLSQLANVIACIVAIAITFWQKSQGTKHSNIFLLTLGVLFLLLIWNIISEIHIHPLITFLALITLITLLLSPSRKKSHNHLADNDNEIDLTSDLIAQAKEQERSRIYANLHDDVGAKLLELIYTAQDEQSKSLAKQVLQDIRQAVASTVNIQCTSKQLIQEFTNEVKMRMQSTTIEYTERINAITNKQKLAAHVPSVISRIIREVISNIIKHAQASEVLVDITSSDKDLTICVKDNGIGLSKSKKNGKGLKTIKKRAKSINAEVEWITNQGTEFILKYTYGSSKNINH